MRGNRHNSKNGRGRSGFSLLELFVATVLFGAAVATFLPLIKSVGQTQRATDRQNLALREASNLLELASSRGYAELTAESLANMQLSETAKSFLPHATLKLDVTEQADPVPMKQIAVTVRWLPKPDRPAEAVRLATWVAKREAQP